MTLILETFTIWRHETEATWKLILNLKLYSLCLKPTNIKRLHQDGYHSVSWVPSVSSASSAVRYLMTSTSADPDSWRRAEQRCWYSPCGTHPLCSPWSSHQTAVESDREQEIKGDGRAVVEGNRLRWVHAEISSEIFRSLHWWSDSTKVAESCDLLSLSIDTLKLTRFFLTLLFHHGSTHPILATSHILKQIDFRINLKQKIVDVVKRFKMSFDRL